jgi:HYR domain
MPALVRGPTVIALALGCLSGCGSLICRRPDGGVILDLTPPQITCPADITQPKDPGTCAAVTTFSPTSSEDCSPTVVCDPPSATAFPVGTTTDTCTVTDQLGRTSSCSFTVTVTDTVPPVITCPENIAMPQDPGACRAVATFSPTFSDDCPTTVVCAPPSGTAFPIGTTTDTCTVTDQSGQSASCSFTVAVTDTVAPVIASIVASPDTLWPPNHKLVPVSITATATDCEPSPTCKIVSVTANEPVLGPGSGNTDPDWVITDPGPKVSPAVLGVQLRAERAGGGSGRVYQIAITCADASGNTTAGATTVTVPHDQGH